MMKALQKANQPIPPELEVLAKSFQMKVERGEANYSGSGFVGNKGYTFDASEMNEAQKTAALQRKAYEIEQGLLPDAEPVDVDMDDDDFYATGATDDVPSSSSSSMLAITNGVGIGSSASSAVASIGAAISAVTGSTSSIPISDIDQKAALIRARLIAQQIAAGKKNAEAAGTAHFCDELDINDYPANVSIYDQFYFLIMLYSYFNHLQARRKVAGRNALDDITERTGVAFISRGVYVAPGKNPPPGERRLHLLIEGSSEMSVRQAKLEIQRALEEETIKMSMSNNPLSGGSAGRYSVI